MGGEGLRTEGQGLRGHYSALNTRSSVLIYPQAWLPAAACWAWLTASANCWARVRT